MSSIDLSQYSDITLITASENHVSNLMEFQQRKIRYFKSKNYSLLDITHTAVQKSEYDILHTVYLMFGKPVIKGIQ